MKNFFKAVTAAISCAIVLSCSSLTAFAEKSYDKGFDDSSKSCVVDEKLLFDEDTLDDLNELVQETSDELDMYICIYLSDTPRSEFETQRFADIEYENMFDPDTDGIFYYMDLSEQYSGAYDYISTSGKAIPLFQSHIDDMLDEIYFYLPSTGEEIIDYEIELAIEQMCEVFKDYAGDGKPGMFDYYYDEYQGNYVYFKNGKTVISTTPPIGKKLKSFGLYGLPAGLFVGLIFFFFTKSHYKFKKGCGSQVYVAHDETQFTQREDRFIRTYTTKTKIESSSGGSRGGRSGGGGGRRGSHGGGGRRR